MERIDPQAVAAKYNSIEKIWDDKDKWHTWTRDKIGEFISKALARIGDIQNYTILNAGSGGHSYGLDERNIVHIDIADVKISQLANSVVGTAVCNTIVKYFIL